MPKQSLVSNLLITSVAWEVYKPLIGYRYSVSKKKISRGGMGSDSLMGTEFLVGIMKKSCLRIMETVAQH